VNFPVLLSQHKRHLIETYVGVNVYGDSQTYGGCFPTTPNIAAITKVIKQILM